MKITIVVEVPDLPIEKVQRALKHRLETSLVLAKMSDDTSMREHRRAREMAERAYFRYGKLYRDALPLIHAAFAEAEQKILADYLPSDLHRNTIIHPDHHSIANVIRADDRELDDTWEREQRAKRDAEEAEDS